MKKIFNKIKDYYWSIPIISSELKEDIFYYFKGVVRGKQYGVSNYDTYKDYINNILSIQGYDNIKSNGGDKNIFYFIKDDPKILAFYLPQFYPNEYNNKWWGKGTTEWTNTTKSVPQYVGQYQPRLPGELGFYDLRIQDNIYRQIELAKAYGIYGFCFYYYWFNGKRLLDLPFDNYVNDNSIDFPFCICWCNENWTKQWSGASNEIIMEMPKTEAAYNNFIDAIIELLKKKNYIRIQGKPVLLIYKPFEIPNRKKVLNYWRKYVQSKGIKDLYIVGVINQPNVIKKGLTLDGFDALSEFAPGPQLQYMNEISSNKKFVCDKFFGKVYDYEEFVVSKKYFNVQCNKLYRAVCPMWDNTARKMNKGLILDGATPDLYKQWLKDIIVETRNNKELDDSYIFINAWNEWAEGAYLEPDLKWQYEYLEATKNAIIETREEIDAARKAGWVNLQFSYSVSSKKIKLSTRALEVAA